MTTKYRSFSDSARTSTSSGEVNPNTLKIERRSDGRLNIKGLALWSTGTFHGHGSPAEGDTFKADDLDAMVQAHNEIGTNLSPRMYAGHPLNPTLKMLARPQGEIKRLRREGRFLLADIEGVNPDFWRKAQEDNARFSPDVKIGHIDQRSGKTYPLSIVGLGVLGSVQPANGMLPSLSEYQTHYYSDAQQRAYRSGEVRSYSGLSLPAGRDRKLVLLDTLRAIRAKNQTKDELEWMHARNLRRIQQLSRK